MTLARSLPDDPAEWWILLGVLVLYVVARWFFAWWHARREGDDHPVRAALAEEDDPGPTVTGGFRSYRQFSGFVGSAIAVVLVAALTDGRLRVVLLCVMIPLLVTGLSYLDFRQAQKARQGA